MPRKVYPDGKPCCDEECKAFAALWDEHTELRLRAERGSRLIQSSDGVERVLPNLENIKYNFAVLKEIVLKMSARNRLSSDPAEQLAKMFFGWYDKHAVHFKNNKDHDAVVWSFKDAWVVHKMFTLLRPKVMRPEKPREARLSKYRFSQTLSKQLHSIKAIKVLIVGIIFLGLI